MQRTGRLIYTTLIEIDAITGLPTGNVKPNVPGDPDYIPPVDDPVTCPLLPEPTTTTTSTTTSTTTTTTMPTTTTTSTSTTTSTTSTTSTSSTTTTTTEEPTTTTTSSSTTTTTQPTTTTTTEEPTTTTTTTSTTTTTTLAPPVILLNFNGVNYDPGSTVNLGQNYNIDFELINVSNYDIEAASHPNGGTEGIETGEFINSAYSIKWIDDIGELSYLNIITPIQDGDIFTINGSLTYSFQYEAQTVARLQLAINNPITSTIEIKEWYIGLGTP